MQKPKEISKYAHMIMRVYASFPPLLFQNTAAISDHKMLLNYWYIQTFHDNCIVFKKVLSGNTSKQRIERREIRYWIPKALRVEVLSPNQVYDLQLE